jgi:hypothetical protein
MKEKLVILIILVMFVVSCGCSAFGNSKSNTTGFLKGTSKITPKGTPVLKDPKYVIGDVVIKNPNDDIGQVITDYNPVSRTYSSRTIIFDRYGTVYYYEGRGKNLAIAEFEVMYPYKRLHLDNPYDLKEFDKEYEEEYSINEIVTRKENDREGIKILDYDYPRDTYTYIYVTKYGSKWVNQSNITYTGARTDIERRYAEIKTTD